MRRQRWPVSTTAALIAALSGTAAAQAGAPPPFRAPVIALAQPATGAPVPQDNPVVLFRFAAGEATDPIDARTFAITVDGKDRSELFRVTATEAWGPLAPVPERSQLPISLGAHQVVARVCSIRGACTQVSAVVTVSEPVGSASSTDRKRSFLDLLLTAARRLLEP